MSSTIQIGPTQTIKTIDQLRAALPKIPDGSMILFQSGQTFPFDLGIDLSGKKNLTISEFGPGTQPPILIFEGQPKNAKGVPRSPVAITAAGSGHSIQDLQIAPGTGVSKGEYGTCGVMVSGSGVTVCGIVVLAGCYKAMGSFAAINVVFKDIIAKGVQYGIHLTEGAGDENKAPHTRGAEIVACDLQAFLHVIRIDGTDGCHVHDNVDLDGSQARCCVTTHGLTAPIIENNKKTSGNYGGGPLAQGQYDSRPPGANKDYCQALQLKGWVVRGNGIVLKDPAGITFDMGVVDGLFDNNDITTHCAEVFNFVHQDRYAMRGPIGGKITRNRITCQWASPTGAPSCPPQAWLKGDLSHIAHGGNVVNGKKAD